MEEEEDFARGLSHPVKRQVHGRDWAYPIDAPGRVSRDGESCGCKVRSGALIQGA